jgi:hypothetical protein
VIGSCATALAGLVALVFGTAGFFKLGDRAGVLNNLVAMGFTKDALAPRASLLFALVVCVEFFVAILLIVVPPIGALCGLAVLGVFTVAVAFSVRSRPTVRCACFGSASQRPVGLSTFLRNALLMLALMPAVSVLLSSRSLQPRWELGSGLVALGLALLGLVILQLAVLYEDARFGSRAESVTASSTGASTAVSTTGLKAAS